jgi:hypothetical protein
MSLWEVEGLEPPTTIDPIKQKNTGEFMSKSLLKAFFVVIIGSLTWFSPTTAMQQEKELCEKCEKRTAKRVYIDPEGEESPSWMKLCGKCKESIREYIGYKQIENEIGYKTALPILIQLQNQKLQPPKVMQTPAPKVPPGCQLPTIQQTNGTINHQKK